MPDALPPTHAVETRLGVTIPARDGVALSANLWLPVSRDGDPAERVPAVLELIPYGKDNWRRNSDVARGEWLAARGFALCRVDVRGTGSSGGVAEDEYTAAETLDGYDCVEWLARQPWCSGAVGMWGISYGGFTAIQVAALRPPHLRAIVPIMATDDRYTTDVHYIGGCLTASELSQYAVSQVAMNAMPPDPALVGGGWRERWRDRLDRTPPWLFAWLRHQRDGAYWRQGSLAPDYGAIECAVLSIGGWMDSYVDAGFRMQARCTSPHTLLVGNWVHGLPSDATPAPNVDELDLTARFFDRWLRDGPDPAADLPPVVWYERDRAEPEPFPASLPGRWRATSAFPHPGTTARTWWLAGGRVPLAGGLSASQPPDPGVDTVRHLATVGTAAGLSWGAGSPPNGLARDLRPDEALAATYTSDPLDAPLSILGMPEVVVDVAASMPVATLVARLADVAPDGGSAQVTAGILNLTHRRSDTAPEPLPPGAVEEVTVTLRAAGYRFAAGHRLRVSIATSAWPVVWPSPLPGSLAIHHGGERPSRLILPVVPAAGGTGDLPAPPLKASPPDLRGVGGEGRSDEPVWRIVRDVVGGGTTVEIHDGGEDVLEDGRRLYAAESIRITAFDADPPTAELAADVVYRWREHEFETEIRARSTQTSTAESFSLSVDLAVDVDGEPFFERTWSETVPRDLV